MATQWHFKHRVTICIFVLMLVYLHALPVYYWLGFAHLLAAVRQLSPCPLSCVLAAARLYTAQRGGKNRGVKGMVSLFWHRHKGIPSPGQGPAHLLTPCLAPRHTHIHTHSRLRSRRRNTPDLSKDKEWGGLWSSTSQRDVGDHEFDELETEGRRTGCSLRWVLHHICFCFLKDGCFHDFVIREICAIFLSVSFLNLRYHRMTLYRNSCYLLISADVRTNLKVKTSCRS